MKSIYTRSEREDRKYHVGDALASAKRVLKGQVPTCTNAISGRDLKEKITLEELNKIADEIVNDSFYYADGL